MVRQLASFFIAPCFLLATLLHASAADDLAVELTTAGVGVGDKLFVQLPPPILRPAEENKDLQTRLEAISRNHPWERFNRDSVMAPVMIDLEYVRDEGGRRLGHHIHSGFVVHTQLATLRDEHLMSQLFGQPAMSTSGEGGEPTEEVVGRQVPEDVLAESGIEHQEDSATRYVYVELPLLNRVLVSGVVRIDRIEYDAGYELWWRLEPSFSDRDDRYANRWTRMERNAVGELEPGASKPYQGLAGMAAAYEVPATDGTSTGESRRPILIETRTIMHEPEEWFGGSNFLRSKLPLSIQERARSFRRKLLE